MGVQEQVKKILHQRSMLLANKPPQSQLVQPIIEADSQSKHTELIDQRARSSGWLSLQEGIAYEKSISRFAKVYLFLESDNEWTVWRGTWRNGETKPFSERVIGEKLPFNVALYRGDDYVQWARRNTNKKD